MAGEEYNSNLDLAEVFNTIDEIFGTIETYQPPSSDHIYPELILQESQHGMKYHSSFQRHNRQFIQNAGETPLVRWRNSHIEQLQQQVVEQSFMGSKVSSQKGISKTFSRPASNALFSWSSDEAYIEARKSELLKRGRKISGAFLKSNDKDSEIEMPEVSSAPLTESLIDRVNLKIPEASMIKKLNSVIDTESNRFVHQRIQIIKTHHSKQISKKINERKRKDHEIHLQRLKLKEEQYEREMRAATEDKEKEKSTKFLGLFNFSHSDTTNVNVETKEPTSPNGTTDKNRITVDKNKQRFSFLPKTNIFGTTKTTNEDIEENTQESNVSSPQIHIASDDLDKAFQMPGTNKDSQDDDFDDFSEFTSSPPQATSNQLPEPVVKNHRFMTISEPKPLIDFGADAEGDSQSNFKGQNKDLLSLL
ncbi:hypothetical protein PSN45_004506 [Yamadazyma tenuis]|uniref:Uncharacterized protein n=1 Tax=Candida tenuis (strain ATCC 10573 / BCRC 21748 / CBS 615 / JCM 9827 / NBRC 10315 / NRRL Y-1498 / VKM Y-70) TaxID=590646 RepID=G3B5G7_CANTC|nr:uncharacterized protein CANTEDRAFT_93989 [Yamadazyma tenuis ATCC 10573]EGV63220.1 hypothetical protein CANTEDRAFT_93989 [Yamadazyma tenuis ATCC 10573]WEJ96960.1 hypothetical protein PSN45_004506 [Yamadazyma tenuis]